VSSGFTFALIGRLGRILPIIEPNCKIREGALTEGA